MANLTRSNSGSLQQSTFQLPALILQAGEHATKKFLEFFAARIRNKNTRAAYLHAVVSFLDWAELQGFQVESIEPMAVALYVERLGEVKSPSTVKQHLAAIRMLFDHFVVERVMNFNPASSVKGPRISNLEGKTPVLYREEANQLLRSIDTSTLKGLRDRAIIGAMIYTFARVGAIARMNVGDFQVNGTKAFFRLSEKGGKFNRVPAHHKAVEFMEAYLDEGGIDREAERKEALFRSFRGRSLVLSERRLDRQRIWRMVKLQAELAGLGSEFCPHSLRATGITDYLANGGDVTIAQRMAGHSDIRTTRLYDRNEGRLLQGEVERIRVGIDL